MRTPERERFARYFTPGDPNDCWEWTGRRNFLGYGDFGIQRDGKWRTIRAHVYAAVGDFLPKEQQVRHTCDNPPCVNPAHLVVGTRQDNMDDMVAKGRGANQNSRKTHCNQGHELTPENTYLRQNGGRECRTCRAAAQKRYKNLARQGSGAVVRETDRNLPTAERNVSRNPTDPLYVAGDDGSFHGGHNDPRWR